jgi:hypothetical protein
VKTVLITIIIIIIIKTIQIEDRAFLTAGLGDCEIVPAKTTCIPKMGLESRLAAFPSATFQQYVYTQKTEIFRGSAPNPATASNFRGSAPNPATASSVWTGTSQPETSAFPPSGNTGKPSFYKSSTNTL